jgi:Zn-dependent peptidase ImmA (M78 family)
MENPFSTLKLGRTPLGETGTSAPSSDTTPVSSSGLGDITLPSMESDRAPSSEEKMNLSRAFSAGKEQLKGLGYGVGTVLADLVGADKLKQQAIEGLTKSNAKAEEYLDGLVTNWKDVEASDGIGDAVSNFGAYIGNNLATQAPQIGAMMLTGLAGGLVGGAVAKTAGGAAISRAAGLVAKKEIESSLANVAAKQLWKKGAGELSKAEAADLVIYNTAVKNFVGNAAGLASAYGMGVGDIASSEIEQTGDVNPGVIAGLAVPYAAMEYMLPARTLSKIFGKGTGPGVFTNALKEAGIGFGLEGTTEAAQEKLLIEREKALGKRFAPGEEADRLKESFLTGGFVGGPIAGVGGAIEGARAKAPETMHPVTGQKFQNGDIKKSFDNLDSLVEQREMQREQGIDPTDTETNLNAILDQLKTKYINEEKKDDGTIVPKDENAKQEAQSIVDYIEATKTRLDASRDKKATLEEWKRTQSQPAVGPTINDFLDPKNLSLQTKTEGKRKYQMQSLPDGNTLAFHPRTTKTSDLTGKTTTASFLDVYTRGADGKLVQVGTIERKKGDTNESLAEQGTRMYLAQRGATPNTPTATPVAPVAPVVTPKATKGTKGTPKTTKAPGETKDYKFNPVTPSEVKKAAKAAKAAKATPAPAAPEAPVVSTTPAPTITAASGSHPLAQKMKEESKAAKAPAAPIAPTAPDQFAKDFPTAAKRVVDEGIIKNIKEGKVTQAARASGYTVTPTSEGFFSITKGKANATPTTTESVQPPTPSVPETPAPVQATPDVQEVTPERTAIVSEIARIVGDRLHPDFLKNANTYSMESLQQTLETVRKDAGITSDDLTAKRAQKADTEALAKADLGESINAIESLRIKAEQNLLSPEDSKEYVLAKNIKDEGARADRLGALADKVQKETTRQPEDVTKAKPIMDEDAFKALRRVETLEENTKDSRVDIITTQINGIKEDINYREKNGDKEGAAIANKRLAGFEKLLEIEKAKIASTETPTETDSDTLTEKEQKLFDYFTKLYSRSEDAQASEQEIETLTDAMLNEIVGVAAVQGDAYNAAGIEGVLASIDQFNDVESLTRYLEGLLNLEDVVLEEDNRGIKEAEFLSVKEAKSIKVGPDQKVEVKVVEEYDEDGVKVKRYEASPDFLPTVDYNPAPSHGGALMSKEERDNKETEKFLKEEKKKLAAKNRAEKKANKTKKGIAVFGGSKRAPVKGVMNEDWIGSGEGRAAQGWGFYTAEEPQVAEAYRKTLSGSDTGGVTNEMIINGTNEQFLDWDKPFSEQSDYVKQRLAGLHTDFRIESLTKKYDSGKKIYGALVTQEGGEKEASKKLNTVGILGNRYLDQLSAKGESNSSNYVVFSADNIKVVKTHEGGMTAGLTAEEKLLAKAAELFEKSAEKQKEPIEKVKKTRKTASKTKKVLTETTDKVGELTKLPADLEKAAIVMLKQMEAMGKALKAQGEGTKEARMILADKIKEVAGWMTHPETSLELLKEALATFGTTAIQATEIQEVDADTQVSSSIAPDSVISLELFMKDSIVKNADGSPMRMFHGTTAKVDGQTITEFSKTHDLGYHVGTPSQAKEFVGKSGYILPLYVKLTNPIRLMDLNTWSLNEVITRLLYNTTIEQQLSSTQYTSFVKELEILSSKAQEYQDTNYEALPTREIVPILKKYGYDGIIYENMSETPHEESRYYKKELDRGYGKKSSDDFSIGKEDSIVVFDSNQLKSAIGNKGTYSSSSSDISQALPSWVTSNEELAAQAKAKLADARKKVEAWVAKISKALDINVRVIDSLDDIKEPDIRESFKARNSMSLGFFVPKTSRYATTFNKNDIYIILNRNLNAERALATLFHELVGHYGFRKVLGSDYNLFINRLARSPGMRKDIWAITGNRWAPDVMRENPITPGGETVTIVDDNGVKHVMSMEAFEILTDEYCAESAYVAMNEGTMPMERNRIMRFLKPIMNYIRHILRTLTGTELDQRHVLWALRDAKRLVFAEDKQWGYGPDFETATEQEVVAEMSPRVSMNVREPGVTKAKVANFVQARKAHVKVIKLLNKEGVLSDREYFAKKDALEAIMASDNRNLLREEIQRYMAMSTKIIDYEIENQTFFNAALTAFEMAEKDVQENMMESVANEMRELEKTIVGSRQDVNKLKAIVRVQRLDTFYKLMEAIYEDANYGAGGAEDASNYTEETVSYFETYGHTGNNILVAHPTEFKTKMAQVLETLHSKLGLPADFQIALIDRIDFNDQNAPAVLREYASTLPETVGGFMESDDTTTLSFIYVDNNLPMDQQIEVALHEFGHVVENNFLQKFTWNGEVRDPTEILRQGYRKWKESIKRKSPRFEMKMEETIEGSGLSEAKDTLESITPKQMAETNISEKYEKYYTSFSEWFARESAKYFQEGKEPLSAIDAIFKGIAEIWKEIRKILINMGMYREANASVKDFYERMLASPGGLQDWFRSNAEQEGVDSLEQVPYYKRGVPRRNLQESVTTNETPLNEALDQQNVSETYRQQVTRILNSPYVDANVNARNQWFRQLQNRVRQIPMISKMFSLGALQNERVFNMLHHKALGAIQETENFTRRISKVFTKYPLNRIQKLDILNFVESEDGDVNNLMVPQELKGVLVESKEIIRTLGQQLVDLGVLSEDTFEANQGAYIRRRYVRYLLANAGGGKKPSAMDYLKEGIPEDKRKMLDSVLGRIRDPQFLLEETIATIGRDVSLINFFNEISNYSKENGFKWMLGDEDFVEVNGGKYSIDTINKQIHLLEVTLADARRERSLTLQDEQQIMESEANLEMYKRAKDAFGSKYEGEYRPMPDARKFGLLRGKYVRNEIYEDLVDVIRMFTPEEDKGSIRNFFKPGGNLEKLHMIWKGIKVPLNPPSWMRNGVSNVGLFDISTNTPIHKIMYMLTDEFIKYNRGTPSEYWTLAEKQGLFGTTFSSQEIYKLQTNTKNELEKAWLHEQRSGVNKTFFSIMGETKSVFAKALQFTSEKYGMTEGWFKAGKLRDYLETWNKEHNMDWRKLEGAQRDALIARATEEANRALFDYSKVPGWLREIRRYPLGSPFITFTYKALPAVMEGMVAHPQKFIKYIAAPYLMMQLFMALQGDDDGEEYTKAMKNLPHYAVDKGSIYVLPWKDAQGRPQYYDFGYILPWGAYMDWGVYQYNHWRSVGIENGIANKLNAGVYNIAAGAGKLLTSDMGFLGGPIPGAVAALLTGRDPFMDKNIIDEGAPASEQMNQLTGYMIGQWTPSWFGPTGVLGDMLNKMGVSAIGTSGISTDSYGVEKQTLGQMASKAIGFNVKGFDPDTQAQKNMKLMRLEEQSILKDRKEMLNNPNLTTQEKAVKLKQYNMMLKLHKEKFNI